MADNDLNILNCEDDPACDPIEDILKEKRIAIEAIRMEMDIAIESISLESEDSNKANREGRAIRSTAEAVRRDRVRKNEREKRDADYDSNERRHRNARKK